MFVTGLGVVCALGQDLERVWQSMLEGQSPVEPIPDRWLQHGDYRCRVWVPCPRPDYRASGLSRNELVQHDPVTLNAVCAALSAVRHAGLDVELADRRANALRIPELDATRCGVFMGTGVGGVTSFMEHQSHQLLFRPLARLQAEMNKDGADQARTAVDAGSDRDPLAAFARSVEPAQRFNPFAVSMIMPNAVAAYLGVKFGLQGVASMCSMACAAGTVAIGQAFRAVRDGYVDMALCGGSEYFDDPHGGLFRAFDTARALARDERGPCAANRPFDAGRSGFVLGQGAAAVLVLESEASVRARSATAIAELRGFAESFDGVSMMALAADGACIERAQRNALQDAGVTSDDIQYINAHGTGTINNDEVEARVIERVFGSEVMVNSTKSLLGHSIGASGALEAVVTCLTLRDQQVHPSLNLDEPIAPLDFVRERRRVSVRNAVSESFAFGGHNAALVFSEANL